MTKSLSNLLETDEVYIIFGGPSLKDFDFSKLNGKVTIGCNKCAEIYETSAVISIDPTYINTRKNFLKNYTGVVALGRRDTKPHQSVIDEINPDYSYFHDKRFPDKLSENPQVLYGTNTGHAAINFSMLHDFKKIHALGLDMKIGHWHGGYTHSRQRNDLLEYWAMHIDSVKPQLDEKGIEMINYNPDSAIRAYEFGDLNSI